MRTEEEIKNMLQEIQRRARGENYQVELALAWALGDDIVLLPEEVPAPGQGTMGVTLRTGENSETC